MLVVMGETKPLVRVIPEAGGEGQRVLPQLWLGTPVPPQLRGLCGRSCVPHFAGVAARGADVGEDGQGEVR